MGEPLRLACHLLAELAPFQAFLRTVEDGELSTESTTSGLQVSDPAFWLKAADELVQELRVGETSDESEKAQQKETLRRLLSRAQSSKRACQRLAPRGSRSDLLLSMRGQLRQQPLPLGVAEALGGLFVADQFIDGSETRPDELGRQLSVDEVIVLEDVASKKDVAEELLNLFHLFQDRLILAFDQGKTVLAVGPSVIINATLYAILHSTWQLPISEVEDYLRQLGRGSADIPQAFREKLVEVPRKRRSGVAAGERPAVAPALQAHVRLLEECRKEFSQMESLLYSTTEALLIRALGWEPRWHDAVSPGLATLAALRAVRLELANCSNRRHAAALRDLLAVVWKRGAQTTTEDGIVWEPSGDDTNRPANFVEEMLQELKEASRLPQLLLVAVEGTRPLVVDEVLEIREEVRYRVYGIQLGSSLALRAPGASLTPLKGASIRADKQLFIPHAPATIVLAQDSMATLRPDLWVDWDTFLASCTFKGDHTAGQPEKSIEGSEAVPTSDGDEGEEQLERTKSLEDGSTEGQETPGKTPASWRHKEVTSLTPPASKGSETLKLVFVNFAQFEGARRSCRSNSWKEVEGLLTLKLPHDAKIRLVQKRLAAQHHLQPSWYMILAPGRTGWRCLLPHSSVLDHAFNPDPKKGTVFLVLSVMKDAIPRRSAQEVPGLLSWPWMPVVNQAFVDRQLVPLEVMLIDARRPFAAVETACRVSRMLQEVGHQTACNSFAVHELMPPTAGGSWRLLQSWMPAAAELYDGQIQQGANNEDYVVAPSLIWEVLPLALSMTRKGLLHAQEVICLPDFNATEKRMPLQRIANRKAEAEVSVSTMLLAASGLIPHSMVSSPVSEAEEYTALLTIEERLLSVWLEDKIEALGTLATESARRINRMVERMRSSAPERPPLGLKEWPKERDVTEWNPRTWDKICRAAAAAQTLPQPGNYPEAEVARSLLWAEVSTVQEILLCLDAIRTCRFGRPVLGGARPLTGEGVGLGGWAPVLHLGSTIVETAQARRRHFERLLTEPGSLLELFKEEVEDLPSDCDIDVAGLHALVQTTNAELNMLWQTQREALKAGNEPQLWHVVRLHELTISALFLLMKHAQGLKVLDAQSLEWLQQVQQGCQVLLRKSHFLCEIASVMAGLPDGDEESMCSTVEEVAKHLESSMEALSSVLKDGESAGFPLSEEEQEALMASNVVIPAKEEEGQAAESQSVAVQGPVCEKVALFQKAEAVLVNSDVHTLRANLLLLALDRLIEACTSLPSARLAAAVKEVRVALHKITPKAMLVRSLYDMPVLDDAVTTFAAENQRRGRKLRLVGRHQLRSGCRPKLPPPSASDEALDAKAKEEAEAAAQAQAKELVKAEEKARQKAQKKKRQRAKQEQAKAAAELASLSKAAAKESGSESGSETPEKLIEVPKKTKSKKAQVLPEPTAAAETRAQAVKAAPPAAPQAIDPSGPSAQEPEEETAPDSWQEVEITERMLLEKAVVDHLCDKRKARLLKIERDSGAQLTLDLNGQAVVLTGRPLTVNAARTKIAALHWEWIEVSEPVWSILHSQSGGDLVQSLRNEANVSVTVDKSQHRVHVVGSTEQVEAAAGWLWRLHEESDSAQVFLGPGVMNPEALGREAEAESACLKVDVVKQHGGHLARVFGLKAEVAMAVEMLRLAAMKSCKPQEQRQRPTRTPQSEPDHKDVDSRWKPHRADSSKHLPQAPIPTAPMPASPPAPEWAAHLAPPPRARPQVEAQPSVPPPRQAARPLLPPTRPPAYSSWEEPRPQWEVQDDPAPRAENFDAPKRWNHWDVHDAPAPRKQMAETQRWSQWDESRAPPARNELEMPRRPQRESRAVPPAERHQRWNNWDHHDAQRSWHRWEAPPKESADSARTRSQWDHYEDRQPEPSEQQRWSHWEGHDHYQKETPVTPRRWPPTAKPSGSQQELDLTPVKKERESEPQRASLAEALAKQFPNARIHVGEPETATNTKSAELPKNMETRLERLKVLIEQDKPRRR